MQKTGAISANGEMSDIDWYGEGLFKDPNGVNKVSPVHSKDNILCEEMQVRLIRVVVWSSEEPPEVHQSPFHNNRHSCL